MLIEVNLYVMSFCAKVMRTFEHLGHGGNRTSRTGSCQKLFKHMRTSSSNVNFCGHREVSPPFYDETGDAFGLFFVWTRPSLGIAKLSETCVLLPAN